MKDSYRWKAQNVYLCKGCKTYQHLSKVCPKCGRESLLTQEDIKSLKSQRVSIPKAPKRSIYKETVRTKVAMLEEYLNQFDDADILPPIRDIRATLSEEGYNIGSTTVKSHLHRRGWYFDTAKKRWVR